MSASKNEDAKSIPNAGLIQRRMVPSMLTRETGPPPVTAAQADAGAVKPMAAAASAACNVLLEFQPGHDDVNAPTTNTGTSIHSADQNEFYDAADQLPSTQKSTPMPLEVRQMRETSWPRYVYGCAN